MRKNNTPADRQRRKQKREIANRTRRKAFLKSKAILQQLYMDKISEEVAFRLISDLGIDPEKVAWDWTDMHAKRNENARKEAAELMDERKNG